MMDTSELLRTPLAFFSEFSNCCPTALRLSPECMAYCLTSGTPKQNASPLLERELIVGIALGFLISGVITIFEYEKAIAEERAHALEIKRLSNPLGKIEIEIWWK
jgi:hypothetical protein